MDDSAVNTSSRYLSSDKLVAQVFGIGALLVACGLAMQHPVWPWIMTALTCGYFLLVFIRPVWIGFLFPLTLIAGDAYPWTGQILVQEYDSLLLGAVAGFLCHTRFAVNSQASVVRLLRPWILWSVSLVISGIVGWQSLMSSDWGDQLSIYFSQYNVLRVAKGSLWGIVFAWVAFTLATGGITSHLHPHMTAHRLRRCFAAGMQCAIVYVGVWILVERLVFESLFDFSHELRASGPFFTMHIGDQHVDAFVVLALPFAWIGLGHGLSRTKIACTATLSCLMIYASIATMSRATMAAVFMQILLLAGYWIWHASLGRMAGRSLIPVLVASMIVVLASFVVLLSYRGDAIRSRFASLQTDWETRLAHWKACLTKPPRSIAEQIVGRGLGTVPTFMAQSKQRIVPPLRWVSTTEGGAIEMQPGWPIYLERILVDDYREPVVLSMDVEPLSANEFHKNPCCPLREGTAKFLFLPVDVTRLAEEFSKHVD